MADRIAAENALRNIREAEQAEECHARTMRDNYRERIMGVELDSKDPEWLAIKALVESKIARDKAAAEKAFEDACKAAPETKAA